MVVEKELEWWDVELGRRLGPFELGMSLNEAIYVLQVRR